MAQGRKGQFWAAAAKVVCIAALAASCGPQLVKLYNRVGFVKVKSGTELEGAVSAISRAVHAPIRDRQMDMDGNPMFLLANADVEITVTKDFGEVCVLSTGCNWKYNVSAANVWVSDEAQKKRVDRAFEMIAVALP